MRIIETIHDIPASPEAIWSVLLDFPSHAQWNPFILSLEGEAKIGERLDVTLRGKNSSKGMTFQPTVLQVNPPVRFAWRGRFLIPGLFNGTHEFILDPLTQGGTRLVHKETFRGRLVPLLGGMFKGTDQGFVSMNLALEKEVLARQSKSGA